MSLKIQRCYGGTYSVNNFSTGGCTLTLLPNNHALSIAYTLFLRSMIGNKTGVYTADVTAWQDKVEALLNIYTV